MCWLSCCFGWLSFRSLLYFLTLSVSLSLSPSLVERKMVDENSCGLLCLISVVIIRRKRMTSMRSFTLLSKNTKIFEIVWVHQLPFHLLFCVCVCYFSLLSARCHCNRLNEIVSIACTPEFVHTNLKKKVLSNAQLSLPYIDIICHLWSTCHAYITQIFIEMLYKMVNKCFRYHVVRSHYNKCCFAYCMFVLCSFFFLICLW